MLSGMIGKNLAVGRGRNGAPYCLRDNSIATAINMFHGHPGFPVLSCGEVSNTMRWCSNLITLEIAGTYGDSRHPSRLDGCFYRVLQRVAV